MTRAARVALPGNDYSEALVRPLTGADEEVLLDSELAMLPAERTTLILSRCVSFPGWTSDATQMVRQLSVGSRELLLLHLRRITFGDRLDAVLACPKPGCGERLDLELQVSDLVQGASGASGTFERAFQKDVSTYRIRFRLPNGSDHETAASAGKTDVAAGAHLILQNCIERIERDGRLCSIGELPESVVVDLLGVMSELDSLAEIRLDVSCAACDERFGALFDTASYLLDEIRSRASSLYREVHLLAFHYHWSESEILSMSAEKRRRYLDLLLEAIGLRHDDEQ